MRTFDIAIVGGGMTGLALACGLKSTGLRIVVLEPHPPALTFTNEQLPASRVSAINLASEKLLAYCNAWQYLNPERLSAYSSMEVWEKDSFAHIDFQAQDYHFHSFGYLIENKHIQSALWQAAQRIPSVTLCQEQPKLVEWGENEVFITLEQGESLSAKLVIGADGAHSWLRKQANIPLTFRDYGQHALVATIKTELQHNHRAYQVFTGDDILAFLPLYQPEQCSIVWSASPEKIAQLQACDENQFNQLLAITFDHRLGLCRLQGERDTFPLTARYAQHFVEHRVALIGDAAHTIHPLAGQGVNLGFRDVIALIDTINALHQQGRDIGSPHFLRQYEQSRKYDAAIMLAGMQGLQQLFSGNNSLKKLIRDSGLALTNKLPLIKSYFVEQAVGFSDLPDWLLDEVR